MIKIFKGFYISVFTVVFFIVCFFTRKTEYFLISYSSMLIHEMCHLYTALSIGLSPHKITLQPFGVNLKLKSTLPLSLKNKILLYLSGPISNIILSIICFFFIKAHPLFEYCFIVNISLFAINLLPIMPLDGGSLLNSILTDKIGRKKSEYILKVLSFITAAFVLSLGIYLSYISEYNYSVIFLSLLIFANIFTSKDKFCMDIVDNLISSTNNKDISKGLEIQWVTLDKKSLSPTLSKHFKPNKYTCFALIDKSGELCDFLTEDEFFDIIFSGNFQDGNTKQNKYCGKH